MFAISYLLSEGALQRFWQTGDLDRRVLGGIVNWDCLDTRVSLLQLPQVRIAQLPLGRRKRKDGNDPNEHGYYQI